MGASTSGALTINAWAPPDKSGYMEQITKRRPFLIAPVDRVLYDGLEHVPVVGYQWDWLTDDLSPLAIPAGQAFETEPSYTTVLLRNRLNNAIKMFRKVWNVAEYTEIIAKNGGVAGQIMSEVARQIMLKMKELHREIERNIASLMTVQLENAPGTAVAEMGGYFSQITTQNATLGKPNTITNFAVGAGQSLSNYLDSTTFENMIVTLHTNGASSSLKFVTTPLMMAVIGRTFEGRVNTRENIERSEKRISNQVHFYAANVGGEVELEDDRSIGDCGLLYDEEQLSIGVADDIRVFRSDPGSFQNLYGRIRCYITLVTGNPQASGGWTTTNTPAAAGN